jgi:hypothetical protein
MATVATRLTKFLAAQTTVTQYVQGRIYETRPPQGKADNYITIRRVSTENADVLNGSVGDGPLNYGIVLECVSTQEWIANAIGDAVRSALHLYRGAFDDATAKGCFVDSESLDLDRFGDGSDGGEFTRMLDTRIFL